MQAENPLSYDSESYREQIEAATSVIRAACGFLPHVAIMLGTDLGSLVGEVEIEKTLSYPEIPYFPIATGDTPAGRLYLGRLQGVAAIVFQGRFHLYEGYTPWQVTIPVRVAGALGVEALLIAHAAAGTSPHMERGELMLVTDHINLQGVNPLTGPNFEAWGPRFPDMSEPYDRALRTLAEEAAHEQGIKLRQGVYVAVVGPNLVTRAECSFLRAIGADVVGMSMVPEVIVARHMGIRTMAVSVITDTCFPDALTPISAPEILAAAKRAESGLTALVRQVLARI